MSWKRHISSLAFRLTAWYTAAAFILLLASTGLLYLSLITNLERNSDLFLEDKQNVVRTLLRERPDDRDGLREEVELESAARRFERFYIRILDEKGDAILTTPGMDQVLSSAQFPQGGPVTMPGGMGGTKFRVSSAAMPVGRDSSRKWTMQIAVDLSLEQQLLKGYRDRIRLILIAGLLVCPIIGLEIARRGVRPLQEVAETAARISSSTLNERIQTHGYPVEIAAMADTFNAMLNRLEHSFARLSRFSADLAHELRTPVNNIRGEAEVALARERTPHEYREVIGSCLEETVRLSDLIGNLLFLARAENPETLIRREPRRVADVLEKLRDYYEASAAEVGTRLSCDCAKDLVAALDVSLIQRALGNLVANAISATEDGTICLRGLQDGETARIEVADSGIGIPPEALPHVFDRFYRVDAARSQASGGTGLGLAIVRGIVVLHGGSVSIDSVPGAGTCVTMLLPVA